MYFSKAIFCLILLVISTEGANILFLHSLSSFSHRVSLMPLANALVERGHDITYIAPVNAEKPNPKMHDIVPQSLAEYVDEMMNTDMYLERTNNAGEKQFLTFSQISTESCDVLFKSKEFLGWMSSKPSIDLLIVDAIIPDCAVGLGYKLDAKVILFSAMPLWGREIDLFHLPHESGIRIADVPFRESMSLWERVKTALFTLGWLYYERDNLEHYSTDVIKRGLNITQLPPLTDLINNISLVFLSGNFVTGQPRALPPMFVSVAGLHVKEGGDPLPIDIETIVSLQKYDGFIYISLGTVIQLKDLPSKVLSVFINTIKSFPNIAFLFRWDGINIPDRTIPDNLYARKWFPQQDLLSHSRIKGFITQGGHPSVHEAVAKGVPIIAFPFVGDQDYNAIRLEEIGSGLVLEITTVTEKDLEMAINKILTDSKFLETVEENSRLFKDLPMKPLDTAIWWVDYVLRNNRFDHLKSVGRNHSWYQKRLLDVWAAIFAVIICTVILAVFIIKYFVIKCWQILEKTKIKQH